MRWLRSPRLRALAVSVAAVFAPLGLARALEPWLGPADHLGTATLLALPAAVVLGAWLGWRVVRPLEKLEAQVRQKTDLRGDLRLDRQDEYDALASAMNALLARLDARQRAHEAFLVDTVHALKSPIAAVRLAAEQVGGEAALEGERRARVARALEASATRLEAVTASLLDLARAEAGLPGELRAAVDVAALVRALAAQAADDGRWSAVVVSVAAPPEVSVEGVEPRLRAALEALLDNARSFARARVHITVEARGRGAAVEVADDGPGIPEPERERVFERFVTTRGEQRGTGLGLALARAVAEAHGGRAHALASDGGARLRLELGP